MLREPHADDRLELRGARREARALRGGLAALVLVGGADRAAARRLGRLLVVACVLGALLFLARPLVKPDGCGTACSPSTAGSRRRACSRVVLLVRRYRRSATGARTPQRQVELHGRAAVLAVLALHDVRLVLRPRPRPQMAVYYVPVRRRAPGAPPPRGARAQPPRGTCSAWSGLPSSPAQRRGLTLKDAAPRRQRSGPWRRARARRRQRRRCTSPRSTRSRPAPSRASRSSSRRC